MTVEAPFLLHWGMGPDPRLSAPAKGHVLVALVAELGHLAHEKCAFPGSVRKVAGAAFIVTDGRVWGRPLLPFAADSHVIVTFPADCAHLVQKKAPVARGVRTVAGGTPIVESRVGDIPLPSVIVYRRIVVALEAQVH